MLVISFYMLVGFADLCFIVTGSLSSEFGYEEQIFGGFFAFMLKPFVKGCTIQVAILMNSASQKFF